MNIKVIKMTHKEIYKLTTEISESSEMNIEALTHEQAVLIVNALRKHVRNLTNQLYLSAKEKEKMKKIATMYRRIDEAKEVVFTDAVSDKLTRDYDSITSYDARKGDITVSYASTPEPEVTPVPEAWSGDGSIDV